MYPHFDRLAGGMAAYIERESTGNGIVSQELFGRFAMDVIGAVAFGIDSRCLTEPDSTFLKMGKKFQKFSLIKFFISMILPKLSDALKLETFPMEPMNFFNGIVKRALDSRRDVTGRSGFESGQYSDFLQLMVDTQRRRSEEQDEQDDDKKGKNCAGNNGETDAMDKFEEDAEIKQDDKDKTTSGANGKALVDDKVILANSLAFFLAGFDNMEIILSLAAYHLAVHQDMQDRMRAEVEEMTTESGGKVTYDAVAKMSYMDAFINGEGGFK
jgi:hypothetical protein